MDKQQIGVLGATSLVGECVLKKLMHNQRRITAFSRRLVTQNCPHITWQRLYTTQPLIKETMSNNIPLWICAAPIWILPEYFDLLLAYGIRRIVVISSTSRFTKNSSSDLHEKKIASQLIKGEELVQVWAATHKIECIILRPTLIYGFGRDKNVAEIAKFIRRFGFFPIFGSAHGLRQPIHVEDVASVCIDALTALNLSNCCYNLTGGESLTYCEMIKRIFAALDRSPRLLTIPLWLFRITTKCLNRIPRYRHWNAAMAERMNQNLVFDNSAAKQDLNFSPRSFRLSEKDLPGQN
ncbi:MAG: NAD-dependent epimerase/dehydratase family protein [Nitrosomonas sp.]|nr:MAG: NAD-dependent epimerase/dehydratase family protein [Nitrosomonas sp.]